MKKLFTISILILYSFCALAQAGDSEQSGIQQEVVLKKKIKVFPNPATHVVNVLGVENSSVAKITISDMYGNAVQTHEWEIRNNALNIPISNLKTGIYMISIRSQEQYVQTKFYKR